MMKLWRGEEVRSRACVRQFKGESRDDVFAATPETSFTKYVLAHASCNHDFAVLIADISVAFVHARMDEELVVPAPPGADTSTFWRLKAALNGSRRASQLWQEHSAACLMEEGLFRQPMCREGGYTPRPTNTKR